MLKKCLYGIFLFSSLYSPSQAPVYPVISLPVVRNGINLTNPWTGGFEAPEFSSADLNGDGINDLFVFDRTGNKVMVFINGGDPNDTTFHYAPQYESLFPAMNLFAVLRDYNHDGIPDIFTYQPGAPTGIEVYKGSAGGGDLHFDLNQYCLLYRESGFNPNIWVNSLGVPAIIDVNNDGALDILTFDIYGASVSYFQNITASLGLPPDSLVFNLVTTCWGNIYVSGSTLTVTLDVSCKGNSGNPAPDGGDERHTGSTLWPVQYGNDSLVNLLLAGAHVGNMVFLRNTGSVLDANIGWQDTLWPSCNVSVDMPLFPAAFQIDADNDGLEDMLVAPNFGYPSAPSFNVNNVFLYKHIPGDTCEYQYSGNDSFLVHTTLDFGTSSKGVFFDFNSDSLMDIVVGNLYYYNPIVPGVSQLALYRNTGARTKPVFTEITTDYMGLSTYGLLNINPAFGDLDGDGKMDMLIGDANGDIDFFKNTGDTVASFPAMTTPDYFGINVGANAAPFIYDVNGDSLPDLVIGNMYGYLAYYWNFGTPTQPMFSADSADTLFGNIDVTLPGAAAGNSQPFIMRDSSGNMLLFVGTDQGLVYEYLIDTAHLRGGAFSLIDSNFLQHTVGSQATMQAYDLNADGKMEYLAGCSRGGLQLFSETVWDSSVILSNNRVEPPQAGIRVFPNPDDAQFTCTISGWEGSSIRPQLFDLLGKQIDVPYAIEGSNLVFSTLLLSNGIYILRIVSGSQVVSAKIVIEHGK